MRALKVAEGDLVFSCNVDTHTLDARVLSALALPVLHLRHWPVVDVAPLVLLCTVAEGEGPVCRFLPRLEQRNWERFLQLHTSCYKGQKALEHRLEDGRTLLLAPTSTKPGQQERVRPVFWGYCLAEGLPELASHLLHHRRLAVVLDLDETLLQAFSKAGLDMQIKRLQNKRAELTQQLDGTPSDEERQDIETQLSLCEREQELYLNDLKLLTDYMKHDEVVCGGEVVAARPHTFRTEDGRTLTRPVIDLISRSGIWLTRIDPDHRHTSMIMRPRPFWDKLRGYLSGSHNQRYEVYVCTAANRQYALEAWRLLDSTGVLIPLSQSRSRITNVNPSGMKNLLQVLQPERYPDGWSREGNHPKVPMSVIVDDRTNVWDDAAQPVILPVLPFNYHQQEAAYLMHAAGHRVSAHLVQERNNSWQELLRVMHGLHAASEEIFSTEVLVNAIRKLTITGGSEEQQARDPRRCLPPVKTVRRMLKDPKWIHTYGLPTGPAPSRHWALSPLATGSGITGERPADEGGGRGPRSGPQAVQAPEAGHDKLLSTPRSGTQPTQRRDLEQLEGLLHQFLQSEQNIDLVTWVESYESELKKHHQDVLKTVAWKLFGGKKPDSPRGCLVYTSLSHLSCSSPGGSGLHSARKRRSGGEDLEGSGRRVVGRLSFLESSGAQGGLMTFNRQTCSTSLGA